MGVESATRSSTPQIQLRLYRVRGSEVILDRDLAALYGMRTKVLNQKVKPHAERFPADFAFQLTNAEWIRVRELMPPRSGRGGQGYVPRVFTEQGVMMVGSILRGRRAVAISLEIIRAFVKTRPADADAIKELGDGLFADPSRIDELEREVVSDEGETVTYFIQSGTDGPIKIGVTTDFVSRFRSLAMSSPIQLIVLDVVQGDIESMCHLALREWRLHGEWFRPSPEVMEFVHQQIAINPPVN